MTGRQRAVRRLGLFVALLAAILASPRVAAWRLDTSFSGHYASGAPDVDDNRHLYGGTARFTVEGQIGELDLFADSRWQVADLETTGKPRPEHRLREGYVTLYGDAYDLRIGKQLILWGRTDRFNPTDNITPTDFRYLTTEQQGQRFGATGATLRWYLSPSVDVTAVLVPHFESSILPRGLVSAGSDPVGREPDAGLDDPQMGLRLNRRSGGVDASVSVYEGFSTLPALKPGAGGGAFVNPEFTAVGADFVMTRGDWAFRGEIAYRDFKPLADVAPDIGPQDDLFAVAGAERWVFDDHLLLVQGMYRYVPDHVSAEAVAPPLQGAAALNDVIFSQFENSQWGTTVSLTSSFLHDRLSTEIGLAGYFDPGSLAARMKVDYELARHWRLEGEITAFAGPGRTNFGALEDTTRVLLQVTYSP